MTQKSANLIFLYGEDSFRSREKLAEIKARYVGKTQSTWNLEMLEAETMTAAGFEKRVLAQPFLAAKRLVVILNLLSKGVKEVQDQISRLLPMIPPSTIVVFYESRLPDRRLKLFNDLSRLALAQEFRPLTEGQLRSWLIERGRRLNLVIEPVAVDRLIQYVDNDLWRLSNELEKLSAATDHLTAHVVSELVVPRAEATSFLLLDQLLFRRRSVWPLLDQLFDQGESPVGLLGLLYYGLRNLLLVKSGLTAREAGIHPYGWQKSVSLARRFSFADLAKMYEAQLKAEIRLKTGIMEPRVALELLVAKLLQ